MPRFFCTGLQAGLGVGSRAEGAGFRVCEHGV